ncbi:hypothetical protein TFLX_02079 [Thermoflexales bacterium]|nr:hypothetical protein TFLX_02079 [Thermoflexales bacterium]
MQTVRVLGALALSVIIGLGIVLLLSSASVRPVYADDGPPPRPRAESPSAEVVIYVDRDIDTNLSTCSAAANDCTLRGAINKANGDPANIYTIYFSPTVDLIVPLSPLPTITANDLWIMGSGGVPRIDGLFMSGGDPFTINANNIRVDGLSIVNVQDTVANDYADIRVIGGTKVQILSNYLGTLPPSSAVTNCTPNPIGGGAVSRNAAYGIFVESGVTGNSGNNSVFIAGNTIGCHADSGILLSGADYVNIEANYIGVNVNSVPITQTHDGISLISDGSNNAPRYNTLNNNFVSGNGGYGILIRGNGTANTNGAVGNAIIGNRIGLAPNGSRLGNDAGGVLLLNAPFQNFIGGTGDNDGNIISGNGDPGVEIIDGIGNGVLGNYIGTTITGTPGVGNAAGGVFIYSGTANIVGGAIYGIIPATKGNVIYSNYGDGVMLVGANNGLVTANDIRYNDASGVAIASGASNNIVGGDVITGANVIGNNADYGINLYGSATVGNVVKHNDILNNAMGGVIIWSDAHDNEIGGAVPDAFNLIRYNQGSGIRVIHSGPNTISYNGIIGNQQYGVLLEGSATQGTLITGTTITGNGYDGIGEGNGAGANFWNKVSLYGNGGLGIDKEASSDTANIIHAPALTIDSVNRSTGVVRGRATGSLLLVIDKIELYRVELDPSGYGEGKTFVGSAVTDADGNWQIVDPAPGSGCYTAFESLVIVVPLGSSEFSRTSCAVMLPTVLK